MVNNRFMAKLKHCDKCGKDYMEAHQSSECPHPRIVDTLEFKNKFPHPCQLFPQPLEPTKQGEIPLEVYHRMELFWYEPETADIVVSLVDGEGEASPLTERLISVLYELGYRLFQPLNDKELRAKIDEALIALVSSTRLPAECPEVLLLPEILKMGNQIYSALLQPKIEEAKERLRAQVPNLVEEAKEQGRERIIKWGEEVCRDHDNEHRISMRKTMKELGSEHLADVQRHDCYPCWQALKGGE